MVAPKHIIDKVFLEVNTCRRETAHYLRDNIDAFLKEELFPELEKLLASYSREKTIARVDELKLEVSSIDWNDTEGMKNELLQQFEEKLQEKMEFSSEISEIFPDATEVGVLKISPSQNQETVFLYFLEKGYLPWFGNRNHIERVTEQKAWEQKLRESHFMQKMMKLMAVNEQAIERFILQFSDETVLALLYKAIPPLVRDASRLKEISQQMDFRGRLFLFKFLLQSSVSENNEKTAQTLARLFDNLTEALPFSWHYLTSIKREIVSMFKRTIPASLLGTEEMQTLLRDGKVHNLGRIKNNGKRSRKHDGNGKMSYRARENVSAESDARENEAKENGIFIQTAGLVLLNPFLKQFFRYIGTIDEKGMMVKEKSSLAVQALHFLATGEEDFFEGNLTFSKFLCGVPLEMPVPMESLLTDFIKYEAETMLKEVIRNWPELKNTSAGGLREMFIKRDGKLVLSGVQYKLIVERRAQDILLEKLNWSVSVVKFAWLDKVLIIEW